MQRKFYNRIVSSVTAILMGPLVGSTDFKSLFKSNVGSTDVILIWQTWTSQRLGILSDAAILRIKKTLLKQEKEKQTDEKINQ